MKKLSILFMSLVAMATTFTSCEDDDKDPAPAVTALELIVKDQTNTVVVGADVQLLGETGTPVGAAVKTDAAGKVTFSNIPAGAYLYTVQTNEAGGCKTNHVLSQESILFVTDQESFTAEVVAGKTTTSNVVVMSAGTVTITNSTPADSFNVYIVNGNNDVRVGELGTANLVFTMFAGQPFTLKYVKLINGVESTNPDDTQLVADNNLTACQALALTK